MQARAAAGYSGGRTNYRCDPVGNRVITVAGYPQPNNFTSDNADHILQPDTTSYTDNSDELLQNKTSGGGVRCETCGANRPANALAGYAKQSPPLRAQHDADRT